MIKQSKAVYIIGSIIIGIVTILGILAGLIFGGVLDARSTKLVFTTKTVEKVYDATALESNEWALASGELKNGHQASVSITGSQLTAGSSLNEFTVVILDQNGADVSGDYEIELKPGTLTVLKRKIELKAEDAEKVYDGTPLTMHEYKVLSGNLVSGHSATLNFEGEITNAGTVENTISVSISNVKKEDVTSNYDVKCSSGTLTVLPREITVRSLDYFKEYDGVALTGELDGYEITEGMLVEGNEISLSLGGAQLEVGESLNTFTAAVVDADGNNLTANYLITYLPGNLEVGLRAITVKSKSWTKTYDGTPLTLDEFDILQGSIPEIQTLTVVCNGSITNVGEEENGYSLSIVDADGNDVSSNYEITKQYGLLKVIEKGIIIKTHDATKTYDGTPLVEHGWEFAEIPASEPTPPENEEGSENDQTPDGEEQIETVNDDVVEPLRYSLAEGHQLVIIDSTEITSVPDLPVDNVITFKVVDTNNNDEDVTSNYTIEIIAGSLNVTPKNVVVETGSDSVTYNGDWHAKTEYKEKEEGSLISGHRLLHSSEYRFREVGEHLNEIPLIVVEDKADGEVLDVSKNYNLILECGVVTINKKHITITTASANKIYDATNLIDESYFVDGVYVPEGQEYYEIPEMTGEKISVIITSYQKDAGESKNKVASYNIVASGDGNRSTASNYEITIVEGTLKVEKKSIIISTSGGTSVYDALAHKTEKAFVNGQEAVDGSYTLQLSETTFETFTFEDFNEITNVGKAKNTVSYEVIKFGGLESSLSNYLIAENFGEIAITERPVVIRSDDKLKSFVYDGLEHNFTEHKAFKVEGNEDYSGLVDGHVTAINPEVLPTTLIDVESLNNSYDVLIFNGEEDVTKNYKLIYDLGTISVTYRNLTISCEDKSWDYDATPHSSAVHTPTGLADNEFTVLDPDYTVRTITEVKDSTINDFKIRVKAGEKDTTSNYIITYQFGKIEINPVEVNVTARNKQFEAVYDGDPFKNDDVDITYKKAKVAGESLNLTFKEVTNFTKGAVDNELVWTVTKDADGSVVDPTNYVVTTDLGTIEIFKRTITIVSEDIVKPYIGGEYSDTAHTVYDDPDNQDDYLVLNHKTKAIEETAKKFRRVNESGTNEFKVDVVDSLGESIIYNYDVVYALGSFTITPKQISITSNGYDDVYDGKSHQAKEISGDVIKRSDGSYVVKDTEELIKADFTESIIEAGEKENLFNVEIIDSENRYSNDNYIINKNYGSLIVSPYEIYVVNEGASRPYSGEELSDKTYKIYDKGGNEVSLIKDLEQTVSVINEKKIVGVLESGKNYFDIVIKDSKNNPVTNNYDVYYEFGNLTILPLEIKIASKSAEAVYSDTKLKAEDVELTLSDGIYYSSNEYYVVETREKLSVIYSGEITDAGETPNTFNVTVQDGDINTTPNYDILKVEGILRVSPKPITIFSKDISETYTGEWYYFDAKDAKYEGGIDGHEFFATEGAGACRDAAIYKNEIYLDSIKCGNRDILLSNYLVNYDYGNLTIRPREIVVHTASAEKQYDATPLKKHELDVTLGDDVLYDSETEEYTIKATGELLKPDFKDEITDFGIKYNVAEYVVERDGEPSTSNYIIQTVCGTLSVLKREIKVSSLASQGVYNGKEFKKEELKYGEGEDIDYVNGSYVITATGEVLTPNFIGSITNAGYIGNEFTIDIEKADGTDSNSNYAVDRAFGLLYLARRKVAVHSVGAHLTYNGEEQKHEECFARYAVSDEESGLIDGHFIIKDDVEFFSYTNAGTYENEFDPTTVKITDGEGDVTLNYDVVCYFGELTIDRLVVMIRTGSAAKVYDGTPLTCDESEWVEGHGILPMHNAVVEVVSSLTPIGQKDNVCIVTIYADIEQTNNVTRNYEILEDLGTLTVYSNDVGNVPEEKEKSDISDDGDGKADKTPLYAVTSDVSGTMYLRFKSFGDYVVSDSGSSWDSATSYTASVTPQQYGYTALKNAGNQPVGAYIKRVHNSAPYAIPYYTDLSGEVGLNDNTVIKDVTEYLVQFIPYEVTRDVLSGVSLGSSYQEEISYRDFVYDDDTYLQLPDSTREIMDLVIKTKLNKNSPTIINDVAVLVSGYRPYSLNYHYEGDTAVYFFQKAESAICVHYATAATALYRALGIPARYVEGIKGEVKAEKETIIYSPGHAWVEVYVDGFGWVPVEVTGGGNGDGGDGNGGGSGGEDDESQSSGIFVKPFDVYQQYVKGGENYLTYNNQKLEGSDLAKLCGQMGYRYEFKVKGEQIGIGKTKTEIVDFKLIEISSNKDVTGEYEFNFRDGVIQIYVQEIDVETYQRRVTYNGMEQTLTPEGNYGLSSGSSLLEGHRITEVEFDASLKNAGKTDIEISKLVISDANDKDVTDYYKINYTFAKLEVAKIEITVTAGSIDITRNELINVYGGELTLNEYTLEGVLAPNHTIEVVCEGKITGLGRKDNKIKSVQIFDELKTDVTSNYIINTVTGRLTVTP